jgi:hypothetical protein
MYKAWCDVILSLVALFKMKRVALECPYGRAFKEDRVEETDIGFRTVEILPLFELLFSKETRDTYTQSLRDQKILTSSSTLHMRHLIWIRHILYDKTMFTA